MEYKKYNCGLYNIYTIKVEGFKKCGIEVIYRSEIKKETITQRTFLTDMLLVSTKEYPSIKKMNMEVEELYNISYRGTLSRVGNILSTNYNLYFLNPKYTEKKMLDKSIKFLFNSLEKPNIKNNKFDETTFNIVKNNIEKEILAEKERPSAYAIKQMLKNMNPKAPFSIKISGYLDDLNKITPENLVDTYNEVFKEDMCDIFVIGDLDMDEVVKTIKKYYQPKYKKVIELNSNFLNKSSKEEKKIIEKDKYNHSYLVIGLNVSKLTEYEKHIVFPLYNLILGGGSLETKLFRSLRTDNSLCYSAKSRNQKYDNLLLITVGIDKVNFTKAVNLTKKVLKEMVDGEISEKEIEEAKKYIITSLNMNYDSLPSLINNYVFNVYDNLPVIEQRIEAMKKVKVEEIIKVAKKVKLNTIYLLEGGVENGNN